MADLAGVLPDPFSGERSSITIDPLGLREVAVTTADSPLTDGGANCAFAR